ncbi:PspC domain-containing protein [Alkalihalophilus pseudofirmus]|uniref:PspC domain-containing protein n=1 Tax=Alkalihalophilus pseudofirmus TaxID=79885 RepID=A0AAJ2KUU5_ALKPS|nr:PspC domain-containing protein [Alkalihalophilus pseudofirmus]MDV2884927.1 PspC domain-containing protein [Alkalihalophilus pseudofirmus]OLS37035.1 PspC domain-containing protein [Alkalihalophilus pseudofirmus]WEG15261.1 PspC domain-containing protein [Alkalihalophilus pseudofirmus]
MRKNTLMKSSNDRALTGVCGGIAEYLGISSFVVRVLFIFLPVNLLVYIILSVILPDAPESLY